MNKIPDSNTALFEKYNKIIDKEISKRSAKWSLTAIPSLSFEDIAQILRLHIYQKIHLYNEEKSPIENWINMVISNRLKNIWRNLYLNYNKPCISCACAEGESSCKIYGEQDESCPLVKHWQASKLAAYNTKLPVSIQNHEQEVYDLPHKTVNIEATAVNLHDKMSQYLTPDEFVVYKFLYIDNKNEDALIIKLWNDGRSKQNASTFILKVKKIIKEKAKKILMDGEIDIIEN